MMLYGHHLIIKSFSIIQKHLFLFLLMDLRFKIWINVKIYKLYTVKEIPIQSKMFYTYKPLRCFILLTIYIKINKVPMKKI